MRYVLIVYETEAGWRPGETRARADVTRWQFWDAAHFSPSLGSLVFEKMIKPMMGMGDPDSRKIEDATAGFRRFGAVLNQRLAERRFVVGEALTVADLTLASSLMYARETEVPLVEFPHIEAWFGRICELEAWKKTAPKLA